MLYSSVLTSGSVKAYSRVIVELPTVGTGYRRMHICDDSRYQLLPHFLGTATVLGISLATLDNLHTLSGQAVKTPGACEPVTCHNCHLACELQLGICGEGGGESLVSSLCLAPFVFSSKASLRHSTSSLDKPLQCLYMCMIFIIATMVPHQKETESLHEFCV